MSGWKRNVKRTVLNALLISASVILAFVAAVYGIITFDGDGYASIEYAVAMAVTAFVGETGILVISALHRLRVPSAFSAVMFGVSSVCYFILEAAGRADPGLDSVALPAVFLGMPSFAFLPLGRGTVVPGLVSVILTALASAAFGLSYRKKAGTENGGKRR